MAKTPHDLVEEVGKFGHTAPASAYNSILQGIDLLYEAAVSGNNCALSELRHLANQIFAVERETLEMGPGQEEENAHKPA
jgi:hypothetical protein